MKPPQAPDMLLQEMINLQRKKLMRLAQELGLNLSGEDILSPQDYPVLAHSARFNFEDGFLAGLLAAQMALRNER